MKKSFEIPFILRTNNGGNGSVIGGASLGGGDGTTQAISYEAWSNDVNYWPDWDDNGDGPDPDDYLAWWDANEFSEDLWEELNHAQYPNLPINP